MAFPAPVTMESIERWCSEHTLSKSLEYNLSFEDEEPFPNPTESSDNSYTYTWTKVSSKGTKRKVIRKPHLPAKLKGKVTSVKQNGSKGLAKDSEEKKTKTK